MQIQDRVGYRVENKFQLRGMSSTSPCLTLPILSQVKWSTDTKILNTFQLQHQTFHGHRTFQHFNHTTYSNQSILSLRLASTTADLIPYSIEQDMEGQTPVLPGWIQVLVTSLIRMSCVDRSYFIPALASYSWWISKKSEATSQAKIYDCGIWWLPARYEILSLLKCRQGMECNWLFMLCENGKISLGMIMREMHC